MDKENITLADFFTVPEMMELFEVGTRYAIYTGDGIEEQYEIEPLKYASKLRLYHIEDVAPHIEDKEKLEAMVKRVKEERGGELLSNWIPIQDVLAILKVSRQYFHIKKDKLGVKTVELDKAILYKRADIIRLSEDG